MNTTRIGIFIIIIGIIFVVSGKGFLPFVGNLPGDIHYQSKRCQLMFPITTMIVLSAILSLLYSLFVRK